MDRVALSDRAAILTAGDRSDDHVVGGAQVTIDEPVESIALTTSLVHHEARELGDLGAELNELADQQSYARRVVDPGQSFDARRGALAQLLEETIGDRLPERELRLVVVDDELLRDSGAAGDLAGAGAVEAGVGEGGERRSLDSVASLSRPSLDGAGDAAGGG